LFFANIYKSAITAQDSFQPLKVIQPSPTAASLGALREYSYELLFGTANITIPLYSINVNNNTLPITLQYTSTGVRVTDNAGWVGLGWSLTSGGVITKTVRGKDDLSGTAYGRYYTAGTIPPVTDLLGSDNTVLSSYDRTLLPRLLFGLY